jgi:hypothetical protein
LGVFIRKRDLTLDDDEFFSLLYQQFTQTTGAEDRFWMPEENPDRSGRWNIYAVSVDPETGEQDRKLVASSCSDVDADFISGVHGCISDLIRRLHIAIDEADRLDTERDVQEKRIFDLEVQVDAQTNRIAELEENR